MDTTRDLATVEKGFGRVGFRGRAIGYETTISGNPSAIVLFEASGTYKLATREVEIEPTTVMACLCARICSVRRQDLGRSQFRNPL